MASAPDTLPVTIPAAPSGPAQVDASFELRALADAARLDIQDLLGKGGMGEVWRCRDAHLGRELALKTSTATDPESQLRFVREARVQGQLEHPGIVPVHELGVRDGQPYFTMKRVRGVTLSEVVRRLVDADAATRARFSPHKLLSLVEALARTLDFAHARGVVHRDVKPGNVMLGDYGEVYLLDWGLAKVGRPGESTGPDLVSQPGATMAGAVMGTPGYMAPEQAAGEVATPASDVWSLGAVLFEVVTLQPLVKGDTSLELLAATHGVRSMRDHAPGVDVAPELEALCNRALDRDAQKRPTARQLADGLEAVLSGQRDLALREQLATLHAERAKAAAGRALRDDTDLAARREALQEVGRALALQPEQPLAQQTFLSLLQSTPSVEPEEVTREVRRFQDDLTTNGTQNAFFAFLAIAPFGLIALWMGIRDAFAFGAMSAAWVLLMFFIAVMLRAPPPSRAMRFAGIAATVALGISQSWALGPFMTIPSLATANALLLMLWVRREEHGWVLALSSLTMLLPLGLQLTGVVTPFYRFEHGELIVVPHALELPPAATLTMLAMAGLGTMLVSSLGMRRLRDSLDQAQRQLSLQRWTLEQLGRTPGK
ncbi:MAG: serine/threonine-protein kinase [Archangium sp.]|nr:serine/threonine-protein kinase [Archangium sp.]